MLFCPPLSSKSMIRCVLIACIMLPQVAMPKAVAGIVWGYVPPLDRPVLQRTEGSGSRGCDRERAYLQLLAPKDHIAATTLERPTFLWYVSNTSMPIRFVLADPTKEKPVLDKQMPPNRSGIIRLELPLSTKLVVGKKYRWTVSLICNEKHPSENTYAYAWMERIPLSTVLTQAIREKDNTQKAIAYAQAGVWYDAVANFYKLHVAHPKEQQATQNFFDLLNQAGLSKVVKQEAKK